jgi:hypothetical protein
VILTDIGLDSSPSCYLCPRLGKRGSPISNHQLQIRYLLGEYMRHSINFLAALILVAVAATGLLPAGRRFHKYDNIYN